jgi:hypothetical protein
MSIHFAITCPGVPVLRPDQRLAQAQAMLDAAVKDEGYDWRVRVSREDGYKVVFEKGARTVIRTRVDEAALEDTVSNERTRLIRDAASELEQP